jgi:subtilisin family serine protease
VHRRLLLLAVPIAALLGFGVLPSQAAPAATGGNYIVVLRAGTLSPALAAAQARTLGATVTHVYSSALRGYAASLPAAAVSVLRANRAVAYIERDGVVRADGSQSGATWGLDRTDQRNLPLNSTYNYTATGSGVTAYIIDTGIRFTHSEFGGRAVSGVDEVDGGTADDCNGHGTHVSGTVGGATYGIAKTVRLVAVRVLDCGGSGATSGVIAGIDWVTANHAAGAPAVANMSLGGGASTALDTAVRNSITDGVSYAIAAGNGNVIGQPQNSCSVSPARVTQAMTIGASDSTDKAASFSNYGTCVDWFAPGVNITSSWSTSDTATNTISGTSMATPHTAGVAALYLQGNPGAAPQTVRDTLYGLTTKGKVTVPAGGLFGGGTPNNHLLFSNF